MKQVNIYLCNQRWKEVIDMAKEIRNREKEIAAVKKIVEVLSEDGMTFEQAYWVFQNLEVLMHKKKEDFFSRVSAKEILIDEN